MNPGEIIDGRFVVEVLAGRGGMGAVYRALDATSGQPVAFKVLLDVDEAGRNRFIREAKTLARFAHPGIARHVAHGFLRDGCPYLAMEWLDGEDLAARLSRGALDIGQTITLATKVVDALAVVHAQGIVHRDVKPENLFLPAGRLEDVKLLDFGVAHVSQATHALTLAGEVLGTAAYMAPEQIRGERGIDGRVDLYAVGCVIFACLAGQPPFSAPNVIALLTKALFDEPLRLAACVVDVPAALDELVARLLEKDPARRPRSARDVLATLSGSWEPIAVQGVSLPPPSIRSLATRERRLVCIVLVAPTDGPPLDVAMAFAFRGIRRMPAVRTTAPDVALDATIAPGTELDMAAIDTALAATIAPGTKLDVAVIDAALDATIAPGTELDMAAIDAPMAPQSVRSMPDDDMLAHSQRFSARLEPLGNGYFAALLTGDAAAHDLAARAARLALDVRTSHPTTSIVIALGRDESGSAQSMGVVIDRAASLLTSKAETILDPTCARLLAPRFDVHEAAGQWLLTGEKQIVKSPARSTIPFVGRDRELSTLLGFFDSVEDEPRASATIITALAGNGKTRLRDEYLKSVQGLGRDVEIGLAMGNPMSAGSPFVMISAALRNLCGIGLNENATGAQRLIRTYVEKWLRGSDALRIMRFVAELLEAPYEEPDEQLLAARADPILMGNQIRRACEDLFAAICADRPLVLILDDMQWGDVATAKVIDGALRHLEEAPFCVLAFARPDIDDALPELWNDRNVQRIRLMPLARKACEKLVKSVLGKSATDERLAQIVERAGGNAFFLEELVRAEQSGEGDVFPETVLAMAQLRIERLESEMRRTLRVASIMGAAFDKNSMGALLEVEPSRVEDLFLRLVDAQILIQRRGDTAGANEYAFRHAYFRDAAYEMLTAEDRVLGHLRVAEQLEGAQQHDALTIAQHFERGGVPARAIHWWTKAVEEAVTGNDLEGAVQRGLHALVLEAPAESKGRLRLLLATACCWLGKFDEADEHAEAAMDLLPACSPDWYSAAERLNWACLARGKLERAEALAERLAALEPVAALSNERAIAWAALAEINYHYGKLQQGNQLLAIALDIASRGVDHTAADARIGVVITTREFISQRIGRASEECARVVELYERLGNVRNAVLEKLNHGVVLISLGAHAEAASKLREALAQCQRLGLRSQEAWVQHCIGRASVAMGCTEEGFAMMVAASAELYAIKYHLYWTHAKVECAWLQVQCGFIDRAAQSVADVLAADVSDKPAILAYTVRAQVHLAHAAPASALEDAQLASSLMEKTGDREHLVPVLLTLAQALDACGQVADASRTIQQAVEIITKIAASLDNPEQRRVFTENVRENREALALAAAWADRTAAP